MRRTRTVSLIVTLLWLGGALACKDADTVKREHLARGNAFLAQNKINDAVIEYRSAIAKDPQFGEAHLKLAEAYFAASDASGAVREYIRAADLLPGDADVQVKAGVMLLATGQFQDAEARARAALAKDPKNIQAQILLGNAYAGLQDFGGALQQLDETITENPTDGLAYASLGYIQAARGDRIRAEAALRRAVAVAPTSVDAHLALADFLWAIGRGADAEQSFRDVLQLDPKNVQANRRLVLLSIVSGRVADAEKYARAVSTLGTGRDRTALADYEILTGHKKEAVDLLEALAKSQGDGANEAKLRLGSMEIADGHADSALSRANDILSHLPNHAAALVLKGQALLALGRLPDALAAATQATVVNPRLADGFTTVGRIDYASNKPDDAIQAYTHALKINPRSTATLLELSRLNLARGGTAGAVQFARQAVTNDPDNPVLHLVLAQALKADGNFLDAGKELHLLETTYPRSSLVQVQLGSLGLVAGDLAAASRAFVRAQTLDPDSVDALSGLVAIDLASHRIADARAKVEARLARTPTNPSVLMIAANVYQRAGDEARLEQSLRTVIEVAPGNLEAFRMLGQSLMKHQRLDEARAEFERVVQQNPKAIGTRTALAVIDEIQHRQADAVKAYEATLKVDSTAAIASNNLAYIYAERGDQASLDAALKLAQTARAQLPNRPEVGDTLGWIYYKLNLPQLAVPQLQDSVQRDPGNAYYQFHLGMALTKTRDLESARRHLEQALKIRPDFEGAGDARKALAWLPS